jgi:hypothetical protein
VFLNVETSVVSPRILGCKVRSQFGVLEKRYTQVKSDSYKKLDFRETVRDEEHCNQPGEQKLDRTING